MRFPISISSPVTHGRRRCRHGRRGLGRRWRSEERARSPGGTARWKMEREWAAAEDGRAGGTCRLRPLRDGRRRGRWRTRTTPRASTASVRGGALQGLKSGARGGARQDPRRQREEEHRRFLGGRVRRGNGLHPVAARWGLRRAGGPCRPRPSRDGRRRNRWRMRRTSHLWSLICAPPHLLSTSSLWVSQPWGAHL